MLMYGITRFIIEFYRGDPRGIIGMFSTSQFISLLLVPLAVYMLFRLARTSRTTPAPVQGSGRRLRHARGAGA
jgi:phosphatidylglycerol:prolipoprotein diacylglycerol transferase